MRPDLHLIAISPGGTSSLLSRSHHATTPAAASGLPPEDVHAGAGGANVAMESVPSAMPCCKPPSKVDRSDTAWGQTCIALRLCPTEPQGSQRALADTAYDILTLHPPRWVSVHNVILVLEGWTVWRLAA